MKTKTVAALIGIFVGITFGVATYTINYTELTAHFLQRLRKEPYRMVSVGPRPLVRSVARFHGAAGEKVLTTAYPIQKIPNWGAMRDKTLWNRSYSKIRSSEFVPIPQYDLTVLTFPLKALDIQKSADASLITAKLFYSTRFFSAYDLDAGEFTGPHAGVDLKLPQGMPVGAIADGSVHAVRRDDRLGLHVILEHVHPTEGTLFSIYGHLGTATVAEGDRVRVGDTLGTVGISGHTSAPHLHLQVDRQVQSGGVHTPFMTRLTPSDSSDVDLWTVHPIHFIERGAL